MNYLTILEQTKERLQIYLAAEKAILEGAQDYKIGNRYLRRADLKEVRDEIDTLQAQEAELESMLAGNGTRRILGVIPRDV